MKWQCKWTISPETGKKERLRGKLKRLNSLRPRRQFIFSGNSSSEEENSRFGLSPGLTKEARIRFYVVRIGRKWQSLLGNRHILQSRVRAFPFLA
jgi:hypothetical protein